MLELIIINGGMGTGKSTLSELLSSKLIEQNYYLKTDDLIWGLSSNCKDNFNGQAFIFEMAKSMIKTSLLGGISIIVEKVMNATQVAQIIAIGKQFYVEILHIVLKLSLGEAISRITVRKLENNSKITDEYLERVKKSHENTAEIIAMSHNKLIFSIEKQTSVQICDLVIDQIYSDNLV